MAESSIYAGDRVGNRVLRLGRIGIDSGTSDPGAVYTGTIRTERIAPAGEGALINFRRVSIHLLVSGSYTFTVKVWVDDGRTLLGDETTQTVVITSTDSGLREVTEEVAVEAEGSHIQVEITVDADDVGGVFLVEKILARGRAIRGSSTREAEAT